MKSDARSATLPSGSGLSIAMLVLSVATGCGGRPELPALHSAARQGDVAAIASLLAAGAPVDEPGGVNGWTPLQHAIHKNQPAAVKALLAAGADANAGSNPASSSHAGGVTPLMMAAGYGQLEIVEALLAAGADPRASHGSVNALWAAAGFGAIADITDGPPLGSCFPEVAKALVAKAPDLRLRWGIEARLTYWLASKDCKGLIDRLRER
jgi:Ankyrin repeats (3 copies)